MESSIPLLLSGLKTAFITPIIGLGVSLYIKIFSKENNIEDFSLEEVLRSLLLGINENTEQSKLIRNAISGAGDSSLNTQVQKLRIEMLDKQDELNSSFKVFAQQMAENNSKALITALEEVMREFNTKISEQFGDNFKHLNEGVGKMLEWQENNKESMSFVVKVLENTKTSVAAYSDSLAEIGKVVEKISVDIKETSDSSKTMVDFADGAKVVLLKFNKDFSEFEGISEKAKKTFESQEKTFNGMSDVYKKTLDNINNEYISYVKKVDEKEKEIDKLNSRLISNMNDASLKNSEIIRNSIVNMEKDLSERMTSFRNQFDVLNRESKKFLSDSMIDIDTNMKNTVNKLGNHLAAIAEFFEGKIK
jgi:hypothetical protein